MNKNMGWLPLTLLCIWCVLCVGVSILCWFYQPHWSWRRAQSACLASSCPQEVTCLGPEWSLRRTPQPDEWMLITDASPCSHNGVYQFRREKWIRPRDAQPTIAGTRVWVQQSGTMYVVLPDTDGALTYWVPQQDLWVPSKPQHGPAEFLVPDANTALGWRWSSTEETQAAGAQWHVRETFEVAPNSVMLRTIEWSADDFEDPQLSELIVLYVEVGDVLVARAELFCCPAQDRVHVLESHQWRRHGDGDDKRDLCCVSFVDRASVGLSVIVKVENNPCPEQVSLASPLMCRLSQHQRLTRPTRL